MGLAQCKYILLLRHCELTLGFAQSEGAKTPKRYNLHLQLPLHSLKHIPSNRTVVGVPAREAKSQIQGSHICKAHVLLLKSHPQPG